MRKIMIFLAILLMTGIHSAQAVTNVTPSQAEALKQTILVYQNDQRLERPPFNCVCLGGPGRYLYEIPAIRGTAYGGPGNYPHTTWICPQGCQRR